MINEDKIIAIFCLVDDLLQGIEHKEDNRRKVSDSEIITTAIISALYFGGHQDNAREFMKMTKLSPGMLDKSRFCRRLHNLEGLICSLFFQIGQYLKDISGAGDQINLMIQRKSNSKRKDEPWIRFLKEYSRKRIETSF